MSRSKHSIRKKNGSRVTDRLLKESENGWRISSASRGAFLIDAADYFKDVYKTLQQARQTVFIIGWDLDSQVRLIREEPEDPSQKLGPFLTQLTKDQPNLQIYILIWDYSTFLSFDRDPLTRLRLGLFSHPRISFVSDDQHPIGASHHQKLIVIDDQIAYCGGIDLTHERWDTPIHKKKSAARINSDKEPYRPFHDVQMKVEGNVAEQLGQLARERWFRATGDRIPDASQRAEKPFAWDRIDFESAPITIARTEPHFKGYPAVKEVEQLYIDLIQSAHDTIYIENQYLTANSVIQALQESLARSHGPEIVLILPAKPNGRIEQKTLWAKRDAAIQWLKKADRGRRFDAFCLAPSDTTEPIVKVHSKIMIVDNRFARVGSSNISNRSMGLDTECDLVLDGTENPAVQTSIHTFRNRLLGEHLSMEPDRVSSALKADSSLLNLIRSQQDSGRLRPINISSDSGTPEFKTTHPIDLEHPLEIETITDQIAFQSKPTRFSFFQNRLFQAGCVLGLFLLLSSLWVFTPLKNMINVEFFKEIFTGFQNHPLSHLGVVLIYLLSAVLFIPINLLILATATLFDTVQALGLILIGSLGNAALGYGVGYWAGQKWITRLFQGKVLKLSKKLSEKGLWPFAIVRLLPIAPFSTINLICGAGKLRFRSYLAGTFFGLLPGALALTFFQKRLLALIQDATLQNALWFGFTVLLLGGGAVYLKKRFGSKRPRH